jgi:hypothetical protein
VRGVIAAVVLAAQTIRDTVVTEATQVIHELAVAVEVVMAGRNP